MTTVELPAELTAENGAKALLINEFIETIDVPNPEYDPSDEDEYETEWCTVAVPVSWTTIKAIYARIVEHMAIKKPQEPGIYTKEIGPEDTSGTAFIWDGKGDENSE